MAYPALAFSAFLCATVATHAAYTNVSHVVDGAGGRSSGGSLTNLSAAAQPGGIAVTRGTTIVNQAGFLNTFVLRPALDTDGDGLVDELDGDNDNDGLRDSEELAGTAFFPTTVTDVNDADSDDDGVSDSAEAIAGTDPGSDAIHLHITAVDRVGDDVLLQWQASTNRTYRVRASRELDGNGAFTTIVADAISVTNTAASVWFVTTNTYRHVGAATNEDVRFYRVGAYR
jgi:hypothetical protein